MFSHLFLFHLSMCLMMRRGVVNGVEEVGGLRIVRAPSSRPVDQPSSQPQLPPPTLNGSTTSQHQPIPPTKKFRASPSPHPHPNPNPPSSSFPSHRLPNPPRKDRDLPPEAPEVEGDEDIRLMQSEAEGLRSRASGSGAGAGGRLDIGSVSVRAARTDSAG